MAVSARAAAPPALAPYSLRDAPSFIELQFPVGRLSEEAFKERDAKQAQTLTGLGSYWIGRKPLILVRAVVLGCLMPATGDDVTDLGIFLKLMAMDDSAFGRRFDGSASEFAKLFPENAELATQELGRRRVWRADLDEDERQLRVAEALCTLPYRDRLKIVRRPEECDETELLAPIWPEVNRYIGTNAHSFPELIEQLGIARFGHRPNLADTFCGGGSIPFEAARMGCDVFASDLNPIACMLTWGAFNIIGASEERRAEIEAAQRRAASAVDEEIVRLGIEHDARGNRAKAFLYCLETRCPRTGWMVPMLGTFVVSKSRNVFARLVPDHDAKRYDIELRSDATAIEMEEAEKGTLCDGRLIHPMNPERSGVAIETIRGDYRNPEGETKNALRQWGKYDFKPTSSDIYQERLYCIQWIRKEGLSGGRQETFFAAVNDEDLAREKKVEAIVRDNIADWQAEGLVPDSAIEPGVKTDEPIRTRGWTHWHHLFAPRQLLFLALLQAEIRRSAHAELTLSFARTLDWTTKLCRFGTGAARESISQTFDTMALDPLVQYGVRSSGFAKNYFLDTTKRVHLGDSFEIANCSAWAAVSQSDIFVTDPPYADAIVYHEITEFFIAWIAKFPPTEFSGWTWNSRRDLAIRGKGEVFRRDMVRAYSDMTRQLPDNGFQVVMFTHQNAGVWADLGGILWAAGLTVCSAWNIVTETKKPSGSGNYVQGTVCLVLRKRVGEANARRMEIEAEIEEAVAAQLARLTALDDSWHERSNTESLYTDGDLTLAAYASALQVVTAYSSIDRRPLDHDLYRKLDKGKTTMLRELVDYAAQVANGLLVPDGFSPDMWRDLGKPERYYIRMLDIEAKGSAKVADFQNFAKSFAFGDYASLMASTTANAASLAGAADLKGRMLEGEGFAGTQLRQVLFATWKTMEGDALDPKRGVTILKTEYAADYWARRQKLIAQASYVALKTKTTRPKESAAAEELAEALKLDRV